VLLAGNNSAICSAIDLETFTLDGAKFAEKPDDVGADSEQLTEQQRPDAIACDVFSPLLAFSQQLIILPEVECSGVPTATPAVRAKSKNSDVRRFAIRFEYMPQRANLSTII